MASTVCLPPYEGDKMTEKLVRKEISKEIEKPSYVLQRLENLIGHKLVEGPERFPEIDYCFHVGGFIARGMGIDPDLDAKKWARKIWREKSVLIKETSSAGPYVNVSLEMGKFGREVLNEVFRSGKDYGKENLGKGSVVVIDMSSPNIAKLMTYAHLRSTIIGDSLANIYRKMGYEVIRDNHVGDWGTQFGNLITAIKHWGDEEAIFSSDDAVNELRKMYEKFHREMETQKEEIVQETKKRVDEEGPSIIPGLREKIEEVSLGIMKRKGIERSGLEMDKVTLDALDELIVPPLTLEGRVWFSKLEKGDSEARRLWKRSVEVSMKEFNKMYEILGVGFEEVLGESFYEDKMPEIIEGIKKSLGTVSEGALVVDLKDVGLDIAIVQKSDGGTVYLTRDLATVIYRQNKMKAEKALYVVAVDQSLHFKQLFEILKRLDQPIASNLEHIPFGLISTPEGKMSSRKGRMVPLRDVIKEGLIRVEQILADKKPEKLENDPSLREKVIRQIAMGALKWNDLMRHREIPVVFDWDKALNLEGNSAPYVQYAAVRAKSILSKAGTLGSLPEGEIFKDVNEGRLIKKLARYPQVLQEAVGANDPSKVAIYVYELAQTFNEFYGKVQVLHEEARIRDSRLKLVEASASVITNALGVLGIEVPEAM